MHASSEKYGHIGGQYRINAEVLQFAHFVAGHGSKYVMTCDEQIKSEISVQLEHDEEFEETFCFICRVFLA